MKKLTEEVKFLKQEILKKNAKYKTSDEKIQHSDFPNSGNNQYLFFFFMRLPDHLENTIWSCSKHKLLKITY